MNFYLRWTSSAVLQQLSTRIWVTLLIGLSLHWRQGQVEGQGGQMLDEASSLINKFSQGECENKLFTQTSAERNRFTKLLFSEVCDRQLSWYEDIVADPGTKKLTPNQQNWLDGIWNCRDVNCICEMLDLCQELLGIVENGGQQLLGGLAGDNVRNAQQQSFPGTIREVPNDLLESRKDEVKKRRVAARRRSVKQSRRLAAQRTRAKKASKSSSFSTNKKRKKRQITGDGATFFNGRLGPVTRKEYRRLSDQERQAFHDAMNALKNERIDNLSKYDILTVYHTPEQSPGAHFGPGLLPFHRELLKQLEVALRMVNPNVAVPYWDSTLDQPLPEPAHSVLWTRDFFGATGTNNEVVDGPFVNWRTIDDAQIPQLSRNRKIVRTLGSNDLGGLFRPSDIQQMMQKQGYENLTFCVDPFFELVHGTVHMWVGGHMHEMRISPNDPTFFIYHSHVDKIWEDWRKRQTPQQRESAYVDDARACNPFHYGSAQMQPFKMTIRDGLSNVYTRDFYNFEESPRCSFANPNGCGSKWLFCDSRNGEPRCISKVRFGGRCEGFEGTEICYQSWCQAGFCRQYPPGFRPPQRPTQAPTTRRPKTTTTAQTTKTTTTTQRPTTITTTIRTPTRKPSPTRRRSNLRRSRWLQFFRLSPETTTITRTATTTLAPTSTRRRTTTTRRTRRTRKRVIRVRTRPPKTRTTPRPPRRSRANRGSNSGSSKGLRKVVRKVKVRRRTTTTTSTTRLPLTTSTRSRRTWSEIIGREAPQSRGDTVWFPITVIGYGDNGPISVRNPKIVSQHDDGSIVQGVMGDDRKKPYYTGSAFAQIISPFSSERRVFANIMVTLDSDPRASDDIPFTPFKDQARFLNWDDSAKTKLADKFLFMCKQSSRALEIKRSEPVKVQTIVQDRNQSPLKPAISNDDAVKVESRPPKKSERTANGGSLDSREAFFCHNVMTETGFHFLQKGCQNTHRCCTVWASVGECRRNMWMQRACQKDCFVCSVGAGKDTFALCQDHHAKCTSWAKRGQCVKNQDWMEENCRASCGKCDRSLAQLTAICDGRPKSPGDCVDNNGKCPAWARKGECRSNPWWMKNHCPRSCNNCFKR